MDVAENSAVMTKTNASCRLQAIIYLYLILHHYINEILVFIFS